MRNLNSAWHSVRARKSLSAHGSDGETIADFAGNSRSNLASIRHHIIAGTYDFSPLLRFRQPKKSGGIRELRVPTIRDRIVLRAIHQKLEAHRSLRSVNRNRTNFAYKPRVTMADLVKRVNFLRKHYDWILTADIVDFFDSIDPDLAIARLEGLTNDRSLSLLIRKALTVESVDPKTRSLSTYDPDENFDDRTGLPQGLAISPVLSNIVLLRFDLAARQKGFRILRYADDVIAFCKTYECGRRAYRHCVELLNHEGVRIRPLADSSLTSDTKASKIWRIANNRQFAFVGLEYGDFGIRPSEDKVAEFEERIEAILQEEAPSGASAIYRTIDSYTLGWFGVYAPLCNQESLRKVAACADRIVLEWMHGKFKTLGMTVGTRRFKKGQGRFLSPRVSETAARLGNRGNRSHRGLR